MDFNLGICTCVSKYIPILIGYINSKNVWLIRILIEKSSDDFHQNQNFFVSKSIITLFESNQTSD